MNFELALVLGLLLAAVAMFVAGKPRLDYVALLMLVTLPFTGTVTMAETLAGFADPNVILIAELFVIGEGLVRTGIARRLGDWLTSKAGGSQSRLLVLLMLAVGGLGAIMSSTGVVAIFIPVVLRAARGLGVAPGRLMMPLSVAALSSGMLTLVATAPNLVASGELQREGYAGFSFFAFTPFGLPILLVSTVYMVFVSRFLGTAGPENTDRTGPTLAELTAKYALDQRAHLLRITAGSPFCEESLFRLQLRKKHGINVIAVERTQRFGPEIFSPTAETVCQPGDLLIVESAVPADKLRSLSDQFRLTLLSIQERRPTERPAALGITEVIVTPGSFLENKTVLESRFRARYNLTVVGLRRGIKTFQKSVLETKLQTGDTLLLIGPWRSIRRSQAGRRDFALLDQPEDLEELSPEARRAPQALLSLAVTVALMVSGIVPNAQAGLIGCLMMVGFRCVDLAGAYRSIQWPSLVLIVGMLPFSLALQRTGGIALAADVLTHVLGNAEPRVLLAGLFVVTAVIGLFISNTATTVLMAPVAIAAARELGLSPYPFTMIVALAASAAFMTPISSPVNTLVLEPGRYTFGDFVKVGVPLTVLVMVISVFLVSWLMPVSS